MDISMDIHGKSVDMNMDIDGKFHIHGKPANRPMIFCVSKFQKNGQFCGFD